MDAQGIRQAYGPFVAAVRDGEFRAPRPDEGWTADMVAAHVAITNDHWTQAARELLAAGVSAYDNEAAVDEWVLLRHLRAVGGLDGLVTDLERSVRDLAEAFDALGAAACTEIPVRIVDDGDVIMDRPGPLADMIEGNATYHLQMHYEQLLALRTGVS
jgi:hypothetical protein